MQYSLELSKSEATVPLQYTNYLSFHCFGTSTWYFFDRVNQVLFFVFWECARFRQETGKFVTSFRWRAWNGHCHEVLSRWECIRKDDALLARPWPITMTINEAATLCGCSYHHSVSQKVNLRLRRLSLHDKWTDGNQTKIRCRPIYATVYLTGMCHSRKSVIVSTISRVTLGEVESLLLFLL